MSDSVGGKVTFSAPGHADLALRVANGYVPQISPRKNRHISGGGVIRTTNLAAPKSTLSIPLKNLTRQEFLGLVALVTHVDFYSSPLTIEDPFETHERMHYTGGLDGGRWSRGDRYACTLQFEQSAADELTSNIIV